MNSSANLGKQIFGKALMDLYVQLESDVAARMPSTYVILGGAPGAGKGTNTNTVSQCLEITSEPIVTSGLLNSPEAMALKAKGQLVGDAEVTGLLLKELIKPDYARGAILDGFPRTPEQADILKELHSYMAYYTRRNGCYPVRFDVVELQVDEQTSIERQLLRGQEILANNAKVRQTGVGTLEEERPTDFCPKLAAERYRTFEKKTVPALHRLAALLGVEPIVVDTRRSKADTKAFIERALMRTGAVKRSVTKLEEASALVG